ARGVDRQRQEAAVVPVRKELDRGVPEGARILVRLEGLAEVCQGRARLGWGDALIYAKLLGQVQQRGLVVVVGHAHPQPALDPGESARQRFVRWGRGRRLASGGLQAFEPLVRISDRITRLEQDCWDLGMNEAAGEEYGGNDRHWREHSAHTKSLLWKQCISAGLTCTGAGCAAAPCNGCHMGEGSMTSI